jgi:hypothetical protein
MFGDRFKFGWLVSTLMVLLVSLVATIVFALDVGQAMVSQVRGSTMAKLLAHRN